MLQVGALYSDSLKHQTSNAIHANIGWMPHTSIHSAHKFNLVALGVLCGINHNLVGPRLSVLVHTFPDEWKVIFLCNPICDIVANIILPESTAHHYQCIRTSCLPILNPRAESRIIRIILADDIFTCRPYNQVISGVAKIAVSSIRPSLKRPIRIATFNIGNGCPSHNCCRV